MIWPVYQYRLNITERWSIFTKNVWNSKQCIAWREAIGLVAVGGVGGEGLMDDQEPDQVLSEQMLVRNPTPAVLRPYPLDLQQWTEIGFWTPELHFLING